MCRVFAGFALLMALLMTPAPAFARNDVAQAREHTRRGQALYEQRRYEEALGELKAAFELREEPTLLYHIALCYIGMGDTQKAVASLRGYLRRMPNAPNRAEVEARMNELTTTTEKPSPPPPPPPPPRTTSNPIRMPQLADPVEVVRAREIKREEKRSRGGHGRALIATGLACTAAGLVLGGIGVGALVRSNDEATTFNRNIMQYDPTLADRSTAHRNLATGTMVSGGILLAAGIVLQVIGGIRN